MAGALLPVCSIFFSTLLCVVYFSKKRIKLVENNVYAVMLITSLIDGILVSTVQLLTKNGITGFENIIVELFNRIDFMLLIIFTNCLFLYTMLITYKNVKQNFRKFLILSSIVDFVSLLIVFFTKIEVITRNGNYSITGTAIVFTALLCLIYIVLSLSIALGHIKNKDKRYIPIFSIVGIAIFLIIMFSFNPYLIIISITLTFINYLMYFTIQNPDIKMIDQLQIAREHADKANLAKTEFLSSMSHEIRTPLNAIVGFSDYIMSAQSLEEAQENAKDIINASGTLLEIVNGILDISKIEAGKLEIVNSKYNAKDTFDSLAKLVTPKMSEKGLDFSYYIAPDIPDTLYGDHANIKKVVTNLLSNAYKYTDKGFVRYEVNCINNEKVSKLIITVEDSGRGIKKENVDKLFTKFQRLEEDRNTTIEGTGLGLAITKQLTELMGGKILVHTIYGEGTKFTVVINQRIESIPISDEKRVIKTTLDLVNKKIALIDDNPLNIKVATKILERYNANNIEAFDNGFSLIDSIKNGKVYDLILLDDMMPKMSGVETLKELRNLPGFKQPVVILTANAITGMKEKYLNEGFDGYLAKPIEKEELISVCNNIFDHFSGKEQGQIDSKNDVNQINGCENKQESNKFLVVDDNDKLISYLKDNDVDFDKSLEFLGDLEMYNLTINDYMNSIEDKWKRIVDYKNMDDMTNYAIEVHSLKSDSKYLGFMKLADVAYEHELKSKDNDIDYVHDNFTTLEEEYTKVLVIAKKYIDMIK